MFNFAALTVKKKSAVKLTLVRAQQKCASKEHIDHKCAYEVCHLGQGQSDMTLLFMWLQGKQLHFCCSISTICCQRVNVHVHSVRLLHLSAMLLMLGLFISMRVRLP